MREIAISRIKFSGRRVRCVNPLDKRVTLFEGITLQDNYVEGSTSVEVLRCVSSRRKKNESFAHIITGTKIQWPSNCVKFEGIRAQPNRSLRNDALNSSTVTAQKRSERMKTVRKKLHLLVDDGILSSVACVTMDSHGKAGFFGSGCVTFESMRGLYDAADEMIYDPEDLSPPDVRDAHIKKMAVTYLRGFSRSKVTVSTRDSCESVSEKMASLYNVQLHAEGKTKNSVLDRHKYSMRHAVKTSQKFQIDLNYTPSQLLGRDRRDSI
jgi:hypothetical protein